MDKPRILFVDDDPEILAAYGRALRKRYAVDMGTKGPSAITYLGQCHELPPGHNETDWLGERIEIFRTTLKDYRARDFA